MARIENVRDDLREQHVQRISVFGSTARDEAGPDSDVDVLVEFDRPVGMFHFIRLQMFLEQILGRKVDLVTPAALRPEIRDQVLRDAVQA